MENQAKCCFQYKTFEDDKISRCGYENFCARQLFIYQEAFCNRFKNIPGYLYAIRTKTMEMRAMQPELPDEVPEEQPCYESP